MSNSSMIESFKDIVLNVFGVLIKRFGFRLLNANDTCVSYSNDTMSLEVIYDSERSFEVGIMVSRTHTQPDQLTQNSYSLTELLRVVQIKNASKFEGFQSNDLEAIQRFLAEVAIVLNERGECIFNAGEALWKQLETQRKQSSKNYTDSIAMHKARSSAGEAWQSKDYQEYVRILGVYKNKLNKSELKKLTYCEKQIRNETMDSTND